MEVVITVEQENAMRAIGGLPPLQERLEQPFQEPLESPLEEPLQNPLEERLEEPLQEPSDMGHDSDGPLHSPSESSSQPLDFMGAGLHLDEEEGGETAEAGKPSTAPLELPDGQPGSWDGFSIDGDPDDTQDFIKPQDNCTPAGSTAPNFTRPGEQNFIKHLDDTHVTMPDDEDHPDNAVDYNQSSEDEQLLEEQGPTLELNPGKALAKDTMPKPTANGRGKEESAAPKSSVVSAERPNRSEPNRSEPNRSEPTRSEPNRSEPNRTGPNRTGPNRTGPNRTGPNRTGPNRTGPKKPSSTILTSCA
jgi:hypothetical protein